MRLTETAKKFLAVIICLCFLLAAGALGNFNERANAAGPHLSTVDRSKMYLVFPAMLQGSGLNATTIAEMEEFRAQISLIDPNAKVTWAMDNEFVFDESHRPNIARVLEFVDTYGDDIGFCYGFANNITLDQFKYYFNEFIYMFRYNSNGLAGTHEGGTQGQMSVWESIPDKYKPKAVIDYSVNMGQMAWLKNTYGIDTCFWAATQYNVDKLTGDGSPLLPYYANINNTIVPAQNAADNSGITVLNSISIDPIGCKYTSGESRFTIHPADPLSPDAQHQITTFDRYYNNTYNSTNTINYLSMLVDINWIWRNATLKHNWDAEIANLSARNSEVVSVKEFSDLWKTVGGSNNENNRFTLEFRGTGTVASDGNTSDPDTAALWTETNNQRLILTKKDSETSWTVVDFTDYTVTPVPTMPYTTTGNLEDVSYIPQDGRNFKVSPAAPLSIEQKSRIKKILDSISFVNAVNEIEPEAVSIESGDMEITENKSASINAVIKDQYGNIITGSAIEYTSSDTSKATVSPDGVVTVKSYTAGNNTALITVSLHGTSISKTTNVTILEEVAAASVKITGSSKITTSFNTSGISNYAAEVKDKQGSVMSSEKVDWLVSDEAGQPIANVAIDSNGKLTYNTSPGAITVKVKAVAKTNNTVYDEKLVQLITDGNTNTTQTSNSGTSSQNSSDNWVITNKVVKIEGPKELSIKDKLAENFPDLFKDISHVSMYEYIGETKGWQTLNTSVYNTVLLYNPDTGVLTPTIFLNKDTAIELVMEKSKIYILANINRTFSDIQFNWARNQIEKLASRLIVSGVSEKEFKPEESITRAEFATLVVKMLSPEILHTANNKFNDVKTDSWYYNYVLTASHLNMIYGYGGNFYPQKYITREQVVSVLRNVSSLIPGYNNTETFQNNTIFSDYGKVSNWAKDSVDWAINKGLLTGKNNGDLNPLGNATRAEACVIISKFLNRIR